MFSVVTFWIDSVCVKLCQSEVIKKKWSYSLRYFKNKKIEQRIILRFTLHCKFCKISIEKYSRKWYINTSFYSKYLHYVCKHMSSDFDYTDNKLFFFFQSNVYKFYFILRLLFCILYTHTRVKTRTVSKNSINLYQSIHPDKRSINCLSLFNLFSIEINSVSNGWKYFVILL